MDYDEATENRPTSTVKENIAKKQCFTGKNMQLK